MDRHGSLVEALRRAVFDGPGRVAAALRRAARDRREVPEALRAYVAKVHDHAYKVTDEEVAALRAGGLSEDEVFELTVAAATGAALRRLEAGLAPLARRG